MHPNGATQRTAQAFPNLWTPLFFSTPFERWFPNSRELRRYFLRDWSQETTQDIDQPPAAAMLVRQTVLDQIGLFDETFWLFYNDVDLSVRMKAAGWKTRYVAEAEVLLGALDGLAFRWVLDRSFDFTTHARYAVAQCRR